MIESKNGSVNPDELGLSPSDREKFFQDKINKKLEPEKVNQEEIKKIEEYLENYPIAVNGQKHPESNESGEFKIGDFIFQIETEQMEQIEKDPSDYTLEELMNEEVKREIINKSTKFLFSEENAKYTQFLKKYICRNSESGEEFDLEKILPPGYAIVYNSRKFNEEIERDTQTDKSIVCSPTIKEFFFLGENLTKINNLVLLLHEIGHAVMYEKLSDEEKIKFNELYTNHITAMIDQDLPIENRENIAIPDNSDLNRVLATEREATAFALKQIRPLIRGNQELSNNIIKYLHQKGLKSYSDTIRKFQKIKS